MDKSPRREKSAANSTAIPCHSALAEPPRACIVRPAILGARSAVAESGELTI